MIKKRKLFLLLVGNLPLTHQRQKCATNPQFCFGGQWSGPTHNKWKAHFCFIAKISNWAGLYLWHNFSFNTRISNLPVYSKLEHLQWNVFNLIPSQFRTQLCECVRDWDCECQWGNLWRAGLERLKQLALSIAGKSKYIF